MITPADSPSSPSDYAGVATSGTDIQAPQQQGEIGAAQAAAQADSGRGSPRQDAVAELMASDPGYADFDVTGGSTAGWPADVTPAGA